MQEEFGPQPSAGKGVRKAKTRPRSRGSFRFLQRRDTMIAAVVFPIAIFYPNFVVKMRVPDRDVANYGSAEAAADATTLSLIQLLIIVVVSAFVWLCFLKRDSVGRAVFYTLTGFWLVGYWSLIVVGSAGRANYDSAARVLNAIVAESAQLGDLGNQRLRGEDVDLAAAMYATADRWEQRVAGESTQAARIVAEFAPYMRQRAATTQQLDESLTEFLSMGGFDDTTIDTMDSLVAREKKNAELVSIAARVPREIEEFRILLETVTAREFTGRGAARAAREFRNQNRVDPSWTLSIQVAELDVELLRANEEALRLLREHWDEWEIDHTEGVILWYRDDLLEQYISLGDRINAAADRQIELQQRMLDLSD